LLWGQGERATNNREQQEIVTLSLQLLQNCLMLVNTLLVERTIEREGMWERLTAEDRRALTPLFYGHMGLWPNASPESWRVPFSTRTLFQILNAKDQQELRHRIAFWPAAFQPVALDLLTGLQSTGFLKSQSTH
jgi:hypothetical protein